MVVPDWCYPSAMSDRPPSREIAPPSIGLTRDHVIWAYRLLLDRDPESDDVIGPKLAGSRDTSELRRHLMTSTEFQQKNPDYAHTNDRTVVIKELEGPGSARLFVDLSDHVIGLSILRDRYERDELACVRRFLKAGDTAIDIGGHVGLFTIHMAAAVGAAGRVYAFEPLASNGELLERSIAENRFEDRVVFQRAAVGAAPGRATLTFSIETLNSGGAYLLRDGQVPPSGHRSEDVPIVALDALTLKRPVRFIKMDVEGAEPQVVKGGVRLLREDRPVILSELHPTQLERASGVTASAFLAQLAALGYRAYTVAGGQPGERVERDAPDAPASVLFLPE